MLTTGIVDIHHDDGNYDLRRAAEGGVVALFHKATEGKDWTDPKCAAALVEARAAGIRVGVYHFASDSADGATQADFFLSIAQPLGDDVLLVLDWETNPGRAGTMTLANARAFVERVFAVTGRWPVLYSYAHFLGQQRLAAGDVLGNCPLWYARYGEAPRSVPRAWPAWDLWQYTNGNTGPRDKVTYPRKVPGFARARQDRSAFRGTADELRAWWATAGRRSP